MRYIFIDLSSDNYLQQPNLFGGYEGEHNETILQVKLPKRMIDIECSGYRFDFQTSEDNKISSPLIPVSELNNDILSFHLTQQLTIAGKLLFNVIAILSDENTVSMISKTNTVTLRIEDAADGNIQLIDPNGYKDELQKMVDERIKEINADSTYVNNTFANALKGTASGSTVHIDDVSPVTHDMKVSVRNNNLFYQSGSLRDRGGLTCTYDEKNQEFTINGTQQNQSGYICLSTFSIPNPSATLPYTICRYKTAGTITAPSADVITYLTTVSITDANISCPNSSYYDADFAISSPYTLDCSNGFSFVWNMGDSGWNPTMGDYVLKCYTAMSIGNLTVVSKRNGDGTSTVFVVNNNSTDIVVDSINSGHRNYAAVYGTVIASNTDVPNNNKVKVYRLDVTADKKLSLHVYYNSEETTICADIDVSDIDFSAVTFGIKAVVGNSMGGVKYTNPLFTFGDSVIQSWLKLGLDDKNKYYRQFSMYKHGGILSGLSLKETDTKKDTEQIWSTGEISEAESYDFYIQTFGAGTVFDNYKFKIQIEQSDEHNPYAYVSDWTTVKVITTNTDGAVSAEYTPNADGTVEGVKSLCPTTILSTDTDGVTIDCEYNRDINKAFTELTSAIISLGGNV